jgi:hypothetical protein
MAAILGENYQVCYNEIDGMEVFGHPCKKSIEFMMNFVHLVQKRVCVKHAMPPIEEKVLNEVNKKHLTCQLYETRKIIKSYSNSIKIGEINSDRIDQKLIY